MDATRITLELMGGPRDGDRVEVAPPPPPDLAVPTIREPPEVDHPTEIDEIPGLALAVYRRGLAPPQNGVHLYHYDEDVSD